MCRDNKCVFLIMIAISLLYSVLFQFVLHDGTMWPAQELGFAVGIAYGLLKEKIEMFINKHTNIILILSLTLFLVTAVGYVCKYSGEHDFTVLSTGMLYGRIVMQASALVIMLVFLSKFSIGNKVTLYIGKRLSMYIFIFHGIIVELAATAGFTGEMRILAVLVATFFISILVDIVVRLIYRVVIQRRVII